MFKDKRLKLNTDKIRCMLFRSIKIYYRKNKILDIKIYKSFIKKLNSYKYLGIKIDSNLNWIEHIEGLKNKLLKSIAILYKTKYYFNENALYYIFSSLLMSHIRYGLLC